MSYIHFVFTKTYSVNTIRLPVQDVLLSGYYLYGNLDDPLLRLSYICNAAMISQCRLKQLEMKICTMGMAGGMFAFFFKRDIPIFTLRTGTLNKKWDTIKN